MQLEQRCRRADTYAIGTSEVFVAYDSPLSYWKSCGVDFWFNLSRRCLNVVLGTAAPITAPVHPHNGAFGSEAQITANK